MSLISLSIPRVLDAEKFQEVANKGVGTYRVAYQQVDDCPNGPAGCLICNHPTMLTGRHPRPMEQVEVDVAGLVRGAWGRPTELPNRWRLTPVVLTVGEREYAEGEGFTVLGRQLIWHDDAPVNDQGRFGLRYRAYREDWISVQHAYIDFAGGPRQAEMNKNLAWAQVEQGMIAVTIPATSAAYHLTQYDRIIPVDAEMDFSSTLDTRLNDTHSRHHFVTRIKRAYGLDEAGARELFVDGVGYDLSRGRFTLPVATLPPKLVIQYRAAPIYSLYLDQGEFRHQGRQQHGKLVTLQREETVR